MIPNNKEYYLSGKCNNNNNNYTIPDSIITPLEFENKPKNIQELKCWADAIIDEKSELEKKEGNSSLISLQKGLYLPSSINWRENNFFGRLFAFFEKIIHLLTYLWVSHPKLIDQQLLAALHFDKALGHNPDINNAPLSAVLKYTCDYLEKNQNDFQVPKSLISQFQECIGFATELEGIHDITEEKNSEKKLGELSAKIHTRIQNLKEGEACIIPADWNSPSPHHALMEIKQEKGKLSLRLISRDPSLPGSTVLASAGKFKLHPFTTFSGLDSKDISPDWLQAFLFLSMPKKSDKICQTNESSLVGLLKRFEDKLLPLELNPTKFHSSASSSNRAKNVWMLVDMACNPMGNHSHKTTTRRKLRLELSSFFEFFASTRNNLVKNETNRILLHDGLEKMSARIALMLQKNEISEAEASTMGKEFAIIEKYLAKASEKKLSKKSSDLKSHKKSTPFVFQQPTVDLKPFVPKKIVLNSSEKLNLRLQSKPLPDIKDSFTLSKLTADKIYFDPTNCHQTLSEVRKQFEELEKNGQLFLVQEQVIGVLKKLEFKPLERDSSYNLVPKTDEFWQQVSSKDREACSRELGLLCQLMIKSMEKTSIYLPDHFFHLAKGLAIQDHLARLNSKTTHLTANFRVEDEIDSVNRIFRSYSTEANIIRSFEPRNKEAIDNLSHYVDYIHRENQKIPKELRNEYFGSRDKRIRDFRQHLNNKTGSDKIPSQIEDILNLSEAIDNILNLPDCTRTVVKGNKTEIYIYSGLNKYEGTRGVTRNDVTTWHAGPLKRDIENTRLFESAPLKSVLKNVYIARGSDKKPHEWFNSHISDTTQESISDNPTRILKGQQHESNSREIQNNELPSFQRNDLRDLLFTLNNDLAPWQIMGLLQEKPHLLDEPDVRNICETLLFRKEVLLNSFESSSATLPAMAEWIESSIKTLKQQDRVLPCLFMIDLNNKLKAFLNLTDKYKKEAALFKDYTHELRLLSVTCLDPSSPSFPHRNTIWTHFLSTYYSAKTLSVKETVEILYGFGILQGSPVEIYEEDVIKKSQLGAIKDKLSQVVGEAFEKSDELLQGALDTISRGKGIPLVEGKWEGKFPSYELGNYQLNVLTGEAKRISDGCISTPLPLEIINSPLIKEAFGSQNPSIFSAYCFEEEKVERRYVFEDSLKISYQVIVNADKKIHLYKEAVVDGKSQWIEFVSKQDLFAKNQVLEPLDASNGLFAVLKAVVKMNAVINAPKIPQWLIEGSHQFWANPSNPNEIFFVNAKGEALYQLIFKNEKQGRLLTGAIDLREGASREVFEMDVLAQDNDSVWDCLSRIEQRGHIIVWRKNGKIDHVELPRLGLSFAEKEGKIVCITPPRFKDWILDLNDLQVNKKGIPFALTLKHPTILNKKSVLIPNGNFHLNPTPPKIPTNLQALWTLLKVKLGFLNLNTVLKSYLKLEDPLERNYSLMNSDSKNPFWAFEVDPHTNEWRQESTQSSLAYFQLAYLSFLTGNHKRVLEFILQAKRATGHSLSHDEITAMERICFLPFSDPNTAAIKLHLQNLIRQKAPELSRLLVPCFKDYLACHKDIDADLKISPEDEVSCWKVVNYLDPEFYHEHAPLLIPNDENERRFVKASFKTKKFFIDKSFAKGKISEFASTIFQSMLNSKNPLRNSQKAVPTHHLFQSYKSLEVNFLEFYKTASISKMDAPDFQKLGLMLDLLPSVYIDPEKADNTGNFVQICQRYLTRVIDLRKEGKEIEFPKIPHFDWSSMVKTNSQGYQEESQELRKLKEESEETLSKFLLNLDQKVGEIVEVEVKVDPKTTTDEKPIFLPKDEIAFLQLEKDLDHLIRKIESAKSARSINEYTINELEKAFEETKITKPTDSNLISKRNDALYAAEGTNKFFKEIENPILSINLDLSTLKESDEPAIKAKALEVEEDILFAKQEAKKEKCWELKSEETRLELEKDLTLKLKSTEEEAKKAKETIMNLFEKDLSIKELWARKGNSLKTLEWDQLLSRYLQQDLKSISHLFGQGVDIQTVEEKLNHYLIIATREQRISAALEEVRNMAANKEGINSTGSQDLYRILTAERLYDPALQPQLLTFEYILGLLIRGGQPKLVEDLLNDPNCVKQAITGSGKTTIILVLASLMKANGSNLVTVTFPKPLFEANLRDLQSKLGKIFSRLVFPLRFNMQMPLKATKKNADGQSVIGEDGNKVKESIFKGMYQNILKTILQKGTIATTKESLHALEQKLVRLVDKMATAELDPIEMEHMEYLGKILSVMRERQEIINDEFDQALTSKEQSHLKSGDSKKIGSFIRDTTLDIYERLLKVESLGLRKNIQEELSSEERSKILNQVATDIAKDWAKEKKISSESENKFVEAFVNYTTGKSEELLDLISGWEIEEKAKVIVLKDQFSTFLPLTLSKTCGVKYMRSKDGVRSVLCLRADIPKENSEAHEVLEKINYLIQDYYQKGIYPDVFKEWFKKLKKESKSDVANEKATSIDESIPGKLFKDYFPNKSLSSVLEGELDSLREQVNSDPKLIRKFLELELAELEVSMERISIDSQNYVSTSKSTSGVSATMGCLLGLHRNINAKKAKDPGSIGKMILNIIKKSQGSSNVLTYDPEHPERIIEEALKQDNNFQSVVDGVAALHGVPALETAKKLLDSQPKNSPIKGIIYSEINNGDKILSEKGSLTLDKMPLNPSQQGTVITHEGCRGKDVKLGAKNRALITANKQQKLEDQLQTAGRLRHPDQMLRYVVPKLSGLKTTDDVLRSSIVNAAMNEADELFRSKKDELRDIVRNEMIEETLGHILKKDYVKLKERYLQFDKTDILVQRSEGDWDSPLSYIKNHSKIQHKDSHPLDVLKVSKERFLKMAEELELKKAVVQLKDLTYSDEVAKRLPKWVVGSSDLQTDQEVEVENEVEVDDEVEVENDVEIDNEVDHTEDQPWYLAWISSSNDERYAKHKFNTINKAFSDSLKFTENFLPKKRIEWAHRKFHRKAHDRAQNPVHFVEFVKTCKLDRYDNPIGKPVLKAEAMDMLDVEYHSTYKIRWKKNKISVGFIYDMRTRKIMKNIDPKYSSYKETLDVKEIVPLTAQLRFFDGEYQNYSNEEWIALKEWLSQQNPDEMETYFVNQVLKNHPQDQQRYPFSKLKVIFDEIRSEKVNLNKSL